MSPATSAARGVSIIVPTRTPSTVTPDLVCTSSITRLMMATWFSSSLRVPTSGTMMLGTAVTPLALTLTAASMMARACISVMSGLVMPRRHPRSPSMGLTSWWLRMRSCTSARGMLKSLARFSHASTWSILGRNSWRGGSSMRMVTVHPSMAVKMPSKSVRWYVMSFSRALARSCLQSQRIMYRMFSRRSSHEKNMCSVRTSPMPWAPLWRASAASSGVSALVKTSMVRAASTHSISTAMSPAILGGSTPCLPVRTSPVAPLREIQSPVENFLPSIVSVLDVSSMCSSAHPHTQGLPHPLATTAAWLVMPPLHVRMPSDACMPDTSSGLVSCRTMMTLTPCLAIASASSDPKTICPTAAPGDAGSPCAMTAPLYLAAFMSLNWG
mmetsp:Transcript_4710/g.10814  ORF Transcript_4710/g.10814 Transcript_4710/m.10814 type:complete len:384 (+) Transcript_4710:524-1675(+)